MRTSIRANRRLTIALTLSAAAVLGITGIASATNRAFEDSPAITTSSTATTDAPESPVSTPGSVDPTMPASSIHDNADDDSTSSSVDGAVPSSSIHDNDDSNDDDGIIDGTAPSSSIDDDDAADDQSEVESGDDNSVTSVSYTHLTLPTNREV